MNKQQIWETYWAKEEHVHWKEPAPEVLALIRAHSPSERPDVLDLGCGIGRHAIAFAQAGYRVTATDISRQALDRLEKSAAELGLSIVTKQCDMLNQGFPLESFDIIVSYNVIYRGAREDFAAVILEALNLLKPGGLFFFTCPTRDDANYGNGECVAPHTFRSEDSIAPGDTHYFADKSELTDLLMPFWLVLRKRNEGHCDNHGVQQFYSNWNIVAQKAPIDK